jgi:hypothetical protein
MFGAPTVGVERRSVTVPLAGGTTTVGPINMYGMSRVRVTAERVGGAGGVVTMTLQGSMTVDNFFRLAPDATILVGGAAFAEIEIGGVGCHEVRVQLSAPADVADSSIRLHIMASET